MLIWNGLNQATKNKLKKSKHICTNTMLPDHNTPMNIIRRKSKRQFQDKKNKAVSQTQWRRRMTKTNTKEIHKLTKKKSKSIISQSNKMKHT